MKLKTITQRSLNLLSTYMSDDLREECHTKFNFNDPTDWINAYIALAEEKDPGFIDLIKSEFRYLIQD